MDITKKELFKQLDKIRYEVQVFCKNKDEITNFGYIVLREIDRLKNGFPTEFKNNNCNYQFINEIKLIENKLKALHN